MIISNITQNNKVNNPNFGNIQKKVFKPTGNGFHIKEFSHNCDTAVFRTDMNWKLLGNKIFNMFKDCPNVATYFYGCSNCSEVYTLIMQLATDYDENFIEKLSPIIAKDNDLNIVMDARSDYLPLSLEEVKIIQKQTGRQFLRFFEEKCEYDNNSYYFKPKPILKDNVKIGLADIRTDYKNIQKQNSIISARNFWVYLPEQDREILAQNLYNHLEGNNLLILGHHDYRDWERNSPYNAINLLKKAGFKETEIPYVLIKEKQD